MLPVFISGVLLSVLAAVLFLFREWLTKSRKTNKLLRQCQVKMPHDGMAVFYYNRRLYDKTKYIKLRAQTIIDLPVSEICKGRLEAAKLYNQYRDNEFLLAEVRSYDMALDLHDYGK